jgi:hypothetical protein
MQSQRYSVDNDDNMMCASVWFIFFGGYFDVTTCYIWDGHVITRREFELSTYGP